VVSSTPQAGRAVAGPALRRISGWRSGPLRAMVPPMSRWLHAFATLLVSTLLTACATKGETKTTTVRRSSGDPLLDHYAGNFNYQKSTDGSQKVVSNQRSQYDGKQSTQFSGDYARKEYQTKAFTTKPWWGTRAYTKSTYSGPTDGSRFKTDSPLGSQTARESGAVSPAADRKFRTGIFATKAAREASTKQLDKPVDALTENRRQSAVQPAIINWKEQRKMQMNDTRSLLGRE